MDRIYFIRTISLWLILASFFGNPIVASAQISYPNFPSCLNPNGTIKVSYDSGTHGVAGDTNSYSGKDTVYTNTNGGYTQCLCTVSGNGIQTNWWKTGSITEEEINSLKASGWVYVPDGSLWGLENASYMAQNSSYSCSTNNNSTNNSNSSSNSNNSSDSSISTRFGQVLGLATTGTLPAILNYFALGFFSLVMFRLLKK